MEFVNPIETQEDFERVHSIFTTAQELNAQMEGQNSRFEEVPGIVAEQEEVLALIGPDIPQEVLDASIRGIAGEQQETFLELSEVMGDSGDLYERIGVLGLGLPNDIEDSSKNIKALDEAAKAKENERAAVLQEKEAAVVTQLGAILQELERVSPRAMPDVKAMLGDRAKGSAASDSEVKRLEDEYLDLLEKKENEQALLASSKEQSARVKELYEQFGGPWVRPKALVEVFGVDIENWVIFDELPVEPKLSTRGHQHFAELHSRHIDQPEASLFTALYLVDHAGEVATVDSIAKFLYSDTPGITSANMRSRVTTLLGPNRDHISKILLSEGYILQYGWRRTLGRTGASGEIKHVKPPERIYQAIALDDPAALDKLDAPASEQGGVRDEFEVTKQMRELVTEHIAAREAAGLDDKTEQTPSEKTHERRAEWVRALNKKIGNAISELETEKLLESEEGEAIKLIRRKTNSRVFGTDETLNKLIGANYLRNLNTYEHNAWIEVILTPAEMVLMKLFNTNKQIFDKKSPRRDQALKLIDAALTAYFENKAKEERQKG